jgi:hypothetical protein
MALRLQPTALPQPMALLKRMPLLEDMPVVPTAALPVPRNRLAIISSTPLALVRRPMRFLVKYMPVKAPARGNGTPLPARISGAICALPTPTPCAATDSRRRARSECFVHSCLIQPIAVRGEARIGARCWPPPLRPRIQTRAENCSARRPAVRRSAEPVRSTPTMQASGRKERLFERLTFIHLQATQCSLDVRRQQLPTENETADRRDPAYCGENYRKNGKRTWKHAEGNHEGDRLESLRDAGQIVNRFLALAGGCYVPRFSAMVEKARKALPLATKLASRNAAGNALACGLQAAKPNGTAA